MLSIKFLEDEAQNIISSAFVYGAAYIDYSHDV